MLKAILREQINQIVTPKQHLLYRMIDAVVADIVQNIVIVKMDGIPKRDRQADTVIIQIFQIGTTIITGEIDIVEIDIAEADLLIIAAGVKEMTIT